MCVNCVLKTETSKLDYACAGLVPVVLTGYNLKAWRRNSFKMLRFYKGNNFRLSQLDQLDQGEQKFLFERLFVNTVHPIFQKFLNSRRRWALKDLWTNIESCFRNHLQVLYYWKTFLKEEHQEASCLLLDIQHFVRYLRNERGSHGREMMQTLFKAVPRVLSVELKAYENLYDQEACLRSLTKLLKSIAHRKAAVSLFFVN